MIQILLVVHIFIGILLVGIILFQKSEGGGLGGSQQSSLFSAKGVDHLFTRITITLAILFALNCLIMGILLGKKEVLFDKALEAKHASSAPVASEKAYPEKVAPEKAELPSSVTPQTPKPETAK